MAPTARSPARHVYLAITVAALGYFVDVFDLILVNVVRTPSVAEMGVPKAEWLDKGEMIVNWQMLGMLAGGLAWGALGDKRGRLSVLFGSIALYSVGNLINSQVQDLTSYAAIRFITGFGLAGELGAGVTLVNEIMSKEGRGWGPTVIAGIGILGGVGATLLAGAVPSVTHGVSWRWCYGIGGCMGLVLLILRIGVHESGMFKGVLAKTKERGNFLSIFKTGARARRYLGIVAVGLPVWYVIGILAAASPEIGADVGMTAADRPTALMYCYIFLGVGDLFAGVTSQWLHSRKRALGIFLAATALATVAYFTIGRSSRDAYFIAISAASVAGGYWAIFVITASEQFGTNLRATATTTAPNFVRGGLFAMNEAFKGLRGSLGVVGGAATVGAVVLVLAFAGLFAVDETFGRDLDFVEE